MRYHPEARKEQRTLPMREQAAIATVIEKLQAIGDRLPFPHSSGVQGTQLRELGPRSGRSPLRPIYRRLGGQMVILSIAPEAEKDPRGYAQRLQPPSSDLPICRTRWTRKMSSKTKLVNAEEVMAENLDDPAFRAYWERTALARAVALWLVNYRVEHGLSQAALARLLGMQQPAIARLEAGEQNPRFDTLLRLADMLGMELHLDVTPPGKTQSLRRQRLRYRMPRGRVVQRVTTGRGTRLRVTAR